MNRKHYLTAILIFIAIFLSSYSSHAQTSSDTIRIVHTGFGNAYYKDNERLSFNQVRQLTRLNPAAYKLIGQSNTMRVTSYIVGIPGGFVFGYALGYALGCVMTGKKLNGILFYPMLGTGAFFIAMGIGFEIGANNKAREGVAVFNNTIKQKNSTNVDLSFSPNGMSLKLNF
jgi:hypothetical protein